MRRENLPSKSRRNNKRGTNKIRTDGLSKLPKEHFVFGNGMNSGDPTAERRSGSGLTGWECSRTRRIESRVFRPQSSRFR